MSPKVMPRKQSGGSSYGEYRSKAKNGHEVYTSSPELTFWKYLVSPAVPELADQRYEGDELSALPFLHRTGAARSLEGDGCGRRLPSPVGLRRPHYLSTPRANRYRRTRRPDRDRSRTDGPASGLHVSRNGLVDG